MMHRKYFWVLTVLLTASVLLGTLLLLQAQNDGVDDRGIANDPRVNERANACYDDPRFLNQCDTPIEWHCGYTIIRYDYALIDREAVIIGGCGVYLPQEQLGIPDNEMSAVGAGVTGSTAFCPALSFTCSMFFSCDEARACFGGGNTSLDQNGDNIPCNEAGNQILGGISCS